MPAKKRKPIKEYALKSRYLGITIERAKEGRKTFRVLRRLFEIYVVMPYGAPMKDALWENIIASSRRFYVITRERLVPALLIHHLNRTVGSTEVSIKFRFCNRGQLQLLFNNLRIPIFFRFIDDNGKNHGRVRGEEAFLICLARLTSTKPLHDLVADFGLDYNWISRSFDAFVRWTERVHGWRLYDNLPNWLTELPRFAEAIRCKLWGYGVEFDPGTFTIFSFIDCTNKLINRVGARPERDGVGALRADPVMMLQQLYYNDWRGSCGSIEMMNQESWN